MKRYHLLLSVITIYKKFTKFTTCLCTERKHLYTYPTWYELYRRKTYFTHGDIWLKFQPKQIIVYKM